jgi:hypothetical protein
MTEKQEAWSVLITLIALAGGGYLVAWRGGSRTLRRVGSSIVAILSALVAFVGTIAYAIPALRDLRTPAVHIGTAVIGNLVISGICIVAWIVAIKFTILALRRKGPVP